MNPIVYLTCEVKHRDLEPRLEIALHLLASGISVFVGQQWSMFANQDTLPKGLVLFKTVNSIQSANMQSFRDAGHLVAATDEEVLNFMDDAGYTLAFREQAALSCDLFFAQNNEHKRAVEKKFPNLAGKVRVVGNPRVDLLAPAARQSLVPEADELRRQYGPFILFNTNFGSTNSAWGGFDRVRNVAIETGDLDPKDPASEALFSSIFEWEDRNKSELTKLLLAVSKNLPDHRIVLRPHPGEQADYWRSILIDPAREFIVTGTNPHPWILASDLVVHAGCTTGLEAMLLDKPTLSIMASEHPVSDRIVNWVNPTLTTAEQGLAAIVAFIKDGKGPIVEDGDKYRMHLGRHLPNYRSGNSAKFMAVQIVKLLSSKGAKPDFKYKPQFNTFKVMPLKDRHREKFSVSQEEFVQQLQAVAASRKLPLKVKIWPIGESLFYLAPDSA